MNNIVIIDYGMGNTKSVQRAIEKIGGQSHLTSDKKIIEDANKIILPGVGAFNAGMEELNRLNLIEPIIRAVNHGAILFGICLGMQLLFESSDENSETKGLGLMDGKIKIIPTQMNGKLVRKIPHIGWNSIKKNQDNKNWNNTIFNNLKDGEFFYFVHSFSANAIHKNEVLAECNYNNLNIVAAVNKGNISGTQFHPENSGELGLTIYKNFLDL